MSTKQPRYRLLAFPSKSPTPTPRFSVDLRDPPFWQSDLMFGDKIQRLCVLSPEKAHAIHVLVDVALRDVWWQTARTSEGLTRLLALTRDDDEQASRVNWPGDCA